MRFRDKNHLGLEIRFAVGCRDVNRLNFKTIVKNDVNDGQIHVVLECRLDLKIKGFAGKDRALRQLCCYGVHRGIKCGRCFVDLYLAERASSSFSVGQAVFHDERLTTLEHCLVEFNANRAQP